MAHKPPVGPAEVLVDVGGIRLAVDDSIDVARVDGVEDAEAADREERTLIVDVDACSVHVDQRADGGADEVDGLGEADEREQRRPVLGGQRIRRR